MNILFGLVLTLLILVPGHTGGLVRRRYRRVLENASDLSQKETPVRVEKIPSSESLIDPGQTRISEASLREGETAKGDENVEINSGLKANDKQPLKNVFIDEAVPITSADAVNQKDIAIIQTSEDIPPSLRQATQSPQQQQPTSTQQNFVQQLIQPLGQFISQFTGGQQSQQQPATGGDNSGVEPANPGPTLPGFLNPTAAITTAQQAVQNVVNSTSQAIQGLQQLASNIGTSFQNTLSNLGNQPNQASDSSSSTPRPPGPIQSLVTNLIGGSPQAAEQQQQQGPLQGIISFFQGGNRPQSTTLSTTAATTSQPPQREDTSSVTVIIGGVTGIDDKIGNSNQLDQDVQGEENANNEVRRGDEKLGEDSFEENGQYAETIVVNDETQLHHGSIA